MKKSLLRMIIPILFCVLGITAHSQVNPLVESGKSKQKSGSHEGAVQDFSEAIKQTGTTVTEYLKRLEEYDKIPSFEKAEKGIEAPPVDVNLATPYYLRGYSYSILGKNDEALSDFNTAIKIDSKLGSAFYERGKLLWTTGKRDEGCIDLGTASSLKDSLARDMFDEKFCWKEAMLAAREAAVRLSLNEYQKALDEIQKSIKLCPDSATYLGMRGRAYLGLSKYELAMFDFDKAISLNKNCVDAYFGRGVAYYTKNKWQQAFDDLAKAIVLDEKYADAYLYRAYACEGMEKNQSALYDYQQAQKLKPTNGLAFFKSGMLRSAMNDQAGACRDFKRAASMGYAEAQDYADRCDQPAKRK